MSDISKRYVKALIASVGESDIAEVSATLSKLSAVFRDSKVLTILYANDVAKEQKVEFLSSLIDTKNDKVTNLLKVLASYGRLDSIPSIANELEHQVSNILNKHKGLVLSKDELSEDKISQIAQNLSKKFDTNIELEAVKSNYNGIKVEVETLGVEIAFSTDRLKSQLSEYILKAI